MKGLSLALFLLLAVAPVGVLVVDALAPGGDAGAALSARHWRLLATTVSLAVAVAAAAMLFGALAATALQRFGRGPLAWLKVLGLATIAVPPYVHALAWQRALALLHVTATGWPMAWWVDTMAYLPIALGMALLALASLDEDLVAAARLARGDAAALAQVALPLAMPQLVAGSALVFILALTDYGVPSLFQVNTYPLEIYVHFSRGGPGAGTLVRALPLLAVAVAAIVLSQGGLRRAVTRPTWQAARRSTPLRLPVAMRLAQSAAVAVVAAQALVPAVMLVIAVGSWHNLARTVGEATGELANTAVLALLAAACCVPIAIGVGRALAERSAGGRLWWLAATLPLGIPAPLVGVALVATWNRPGLGVLYGTLAMPLLAAMARFLPLACLVMAAQFLRIDPQLFEAARLFEHRRLRRAVVAELPMILPGMVAAACLVAALTSGELAATLIVAPPGEATLTMRIYNYLHYGAAESVAGLCLVLMALALGLAAALLALLGRMRAGRQGAAA